MWNEYKRPMWTDNPFAKDKLELGFNAYEASHCCFGEDGTDADSSSVEDASLGLKGALTPDEIEDLNKTLDDYNITDFDAQRAVIDDFSKAKGEGEFDMGGFYEPDGGLTATQVGAQAMAQDARDALDAAQAAKDAASEGLEKADEPVNTPTFKDFYAVKDDYNKYDDLLNVVPKTEDYVEWNKRPALPADDKNNPIGHHVMGSDGWEVAYKDLNEVKKAINSNQSADFKTDTIGGKPTSTMIGEPYKKDGLISLMTTSPLWEAVKAFTGTTDKYAGKSLGIIGEAVGFPQNLLWNLATDFHNKATNRSQINQVDKPQITGVSSYFDTPTKKAVENERFQNLLKEGRAGPKIDKQEDRRRAFDLNQESSRIANRRQQEINQLRDSGLKAAIANEREADSTAAVLNAIGARDAKKDAALTKTAAQNWQDFQAKLNAAGVRSQIAGGARDAKINNLFDAVQEGRNPTEAFNDLVKKGVSRSEAIKLLEDAKKTASFDRSYAHGGPIRKGLSSLRYRQEGGEVAEDERMILPQPEPEPEEEITGSPMEQYFKRQQKTPYWSREPNQYLTELMDKLRPGREPQDIWRRLGWSPVATPPKPVPEPVPLPQPVPGPITGPIPGPITGPIGGPVEPMPGPVGPMPGPIMPPGSPPPPRYEDPTPAPPSWDSDVRELNDYMGLSYEDSQKKYERDLGGANLDYGADGAGYDISHVRPPPMEYDKYMDRYNPEGSVPNWMRDEEDEGGYKPVLPPPRG